MIRPTVARVDLAAIEANFKTISAFLHRPSPIGHRPSDNERRATPRVIAVVKANAYGHGAAEVGLALERAGAAMLACADIEEGIVLRRAGVKIPIIALSQLSRAPETRSDHRPQLSDLRESGALEQDADLVMFIFREEQYRTEDGQADQDTEGVAEIIVGKQRNGPTGTVKLAFVKEHTRFENLAQGAA